MKPVSQKQGEQEKDTRGPQGKEDQTQKKKYSKYKGKAEKDARDINKGITQREKCPGGMGEGSQHEPYESRES